MPVSNTKFSEFVDGGDLTLGDVVVGLRGGLNTKFDYTGALPPGVIVEMSQGGTGSNLTPALGAIPYSTATQIELLAPTATANQMFQSGANAAPHWSTATWPVTTTINQVLFSSAANTVDAIATANGATFVTSSTGVPSWLANPGATGRIYTSVTGDTPAWSTATFPLTAGADGTVIRSNGSNWLASTSTFADTYALNSILYAGTANTVTGLAPAISSVLASSLTGVPTWLGPLTDGQIIIGSTGAIPVAASLTAGSGITITPAAGAITIAATTGGLTWSTIAGTTQAAAVNNGYVAGNAAQTTVTLPATFAVGDVVRLEGLGAAGWILAANTGDTIQIGAGVTSSGGSLTSAAATDNIFVTGIVANTTWRVTTTNSAGLTIA